MLDYKKGTANDASFNHAPIHSLRNCMNYGIRTYKRKHRKKLSFQPIPFQKTNTKGFNDFYTKLFNRWPKETIVLQSPSNRILFAPRRTVDATEYGAEAKKASSIKRVVKRTTLHLESNFFLCIPTRTINEAVQTHNDRIKPNTKGFRNRMTQRDENNETTTYQIRLTKKVENIFDALSHKPD